MEISCGVGASELDVAGERLSPSAPGRLRSAASRARFQYAAIDCKMVSIVKSPIEERAVQVAIGQEVCGSFSWRE